VREPDELDEQPARIVGAQCIPLGELGKRLAEVPADCPVIPVCHAGARSAQATQILKKAGYGRVANLRGGMLLWKQLGLPQTVTG
jgi:rhodanese-related sulfurtransferase